MRRSDENTRGSVDHVWSARVPLAAVDWEVVNMQVGLLDRRQQYDRRMSRKFPNRRPTSIQVSVLDSFVGDSLALSPRYIREVASQANRDPAWHPRS